MCPNSFWLDLDICEFIWTQLSGSLTDCIRAWFTELLFLCRQKVRPKDTETGAALIFVFYRNTLSKTHLLIWQTCATNNKSGATSVKTESANFKSHLQFNLWLRKSGPEWLKVHKPDEYFIITANVEFVYHSYLTLQSTSPDK